MNSAHSDDWDSIWKAGLQPGQRFDLGRPHHVLKKLVEDGFLPSGGRALVPGCGRGYDLALFAGSASMDATGLELSETAAEEAMKFLTSTAPDLVAAGKIHVQSGDFFSYTAEPFDLVYDYTFLCALLPSRRAEWAAKMAQLVKPGGKLVTMQFPLGPYPHGMPDDPTRGPPFQLNKPLYVELLEGSEAKKGFVLEYEADVPPDMSGPKRAGLEAVAIWKRV